MDQDAERSQRGAVPPASSGERLATILETVADGILLLTPGGTITYANAAAGALLGCTPEQLLGRAYVDLFLRITHENGEPLGEDELPHVPAAQGEDPGRSVHVVLRRDGRRLVLSKHALPVRDERGSVIEVVASIRDVTLSRAASERLRRHARQQDVIARLARAALGATPIPELVQQALALVRDAMQCDYAAFARFDPDRNDFLLEAAPGLPRDDVGLARLPATAGSLGGVALQTGGAVLVEDFRADLRMEPSELLRRYGVLSGIAAIIDGPGQAAGLIAVFAQEARRFSEEDALFLQAIADLVSQDVQRDHTEQALRLSEERQGVLLHHSHEILSILTPEGLVRSVRGGVERVLGYTPAELEGFPYADLLHPDDCDFALELAQHSIASPGELITCKVRVRHKDGSWRLLESTFRNLLDHPAIGGIVTNTRDVSEQQHARATVRHVSGHLAALLDTSPLAIIVLAPDRTVHVWNRAAEQLFGYPAAEVVGGPYPLRAAEGEPDEPDDIFEAGLRGRSYRRETVRRLHRDGRTLELEFWNAPLRDATGQVVFMVGIFNDVTAHRQLEAQLRQSQKMEAVGRLAGGVAHDFNNILAALAGYAELLEQSISPHDPLAECVQEIRLSVDRAARLTRQLLAFSRKQVIKPRVLDLNVVLVELRKLLRRLVGDDVELELHTDPGLMPVLADPGQIEQVIVNLAINARDAMPDGGRLDIATANVRLPAPHATGLDPVLPGGEYVLLRVTDSGLGIPPEVRAHIFEPFFTTKDPSKGTGLGLATVYGIVQQSRGAIAVDSVPDQGTTFRIYLPATRQRPLVETAAAPPAPAAGGEVVLLVEDEPVVRSLTRQMLRRDGLTVLEAENGGEAILIADRYPGHIDLLLTDIVMPRMTGRELAEHLLRSRPDLRVLYMSGYTADTISHEGVLEDGVRFLQKPFTVQDLQRAVHEALQG